MFSTLYIKSRKLYRNLGIAVYLSTIIKNLLHIFQDDSEPLVDYGGSYGDQTCWTTLSNHQQQQVQQHQFPSMSVNVSMNMTMHGYAPIHGDAQFGCQPVIITIF